MSPASRSARAHLTLVSPAKEGSPSPSPSPSDSAAERRQSPRLTLSELEWLNGVRLKYGPTVSLIDLSAGGAQIETSNRLQPGATVVVQLSGPEGEVALPSSVVRCQVSRVVPYTTYRSSLAFKRPFEPPRAVASEDDAVANLVHEHARIAQALAQRARAAGEPSLALSAAGEAALAATMALVESAPTQRAGSRFSQQMTQIFRALTQEIETDTAPDAMLAGLAERLRRTVPAKTIRIVDGTAPLGPHGPDTIYFDAAVDGQIVARLVVEFPSSCQLEDWHLHFLKTAAQLVAFVSDVARLRAVETLVVATVPTANEVAAIKAPAVPRSGPSTSPVAEGHGWSPLVARYQDGRMLKGYGRTFFPARGFVQVSPVPDAPSAAVIAVPLKQLKAVFFVHDLERAPADLDPTPTARGRRVEVTFLDGEVLTGTTLNYTAEGPGFFVSPTEERGNNNARIFAVTAAIRQVQFP